MPGNDKENNHSREVPGGEGGKKQYVMKKLRGPRLSTAETPRSREEKQTKEIKKNQNKRGKTRRSEQKKKEDRRQRPRQSRKPRETIKTTQR